MGIYTFPHYPFTQQISECFPKDFEITFLRLLLKDYEDYFYYKV